MKGAFLAGLLCAGSLLAAAALAAPAARPPQRVSTGFLAIGAQKGAPIIAYPRIQSLKGDYSYRAFPDRVVIRDNAAQVSAVIEVLDRAQPVYPRFRGTLEADSQLTEKLGPAVSAPAQLFSGKLWAQVFLGGTMLQEEESRVIWWGWHAQRSLKLLPAEPAPAPAAAGAVIDQAGALTPEERADLERALAGLRARTGLAVGIAFVPEMPTEAARQKAADLRQGLVGAQRLPAASGLLLLEGARSYVWHRDSRLDLQVPWEKIQAAWSSGPAGARLGARGLAFVQALEAQLKGEVTPAPPPPNGMGAQDDRLAPPEPAPIAVRRLRALAQGTVTDAAGAEIRTPDGLTLRFPPGAVPGSRSLTVFAAESPPPPVTIRGVGEANGVPMKTLAAWDVDLGSIRGLLPQPVEVSIDLSRFQRADGKIPALAPAETLDGRTWSFVPYEIRGKSLVFRTRHFSPKILGAHPALWVTLGLVAAGYLVYYRADELPSVCGADAPFVSSGAPNAQGFEICWSVKMPGVDPKTGLRDEAGFKKALEDRERGGFVIQDTEKNELRRQYLMPEAARRVEEALVFAQAYLARRGFSKPYLSLPVYIVPSLKENEGLLYNPWTGRRYILIGGNLDARGTYRAALHELFHHYQVGYNWISDGDSAFMEACATLIEREAGRDPEYRKKLAEVAKDAGGLLNPNDNNARLDVYRTGLAGPAYSRDPKPAQRHGYGLSWFLEYLRDKKHPTNPEQFLPDLMSHCSSYNAPDAFKWAAGSSYYLATRFREFAEEMVLKGMPTETYYGKLYYPGSPHQVWETPYRTADTLDLGRDSTLELGGSIPAWSIQGYRLKPPAGAKAKLLVQVPDEWFAGTTKRGAYLRSSPRDVEARDYQSVRRPGDTAVALPFDQERYFYLVDTGQSVKPARLWTLEPPTALLQWGEGGKIRCSWKVPAAARKWPELFKGYRVYLTVRGEPKPVQVVEVNDPNPDFAKNPVILDPAAAKLTPEQLKKGLAVYVTTVTREGLVAVPGAAGKPGPLESEPSDPAGLAADGTVAVVVHEPKPEKLPQNPFEVLDGTPTPGAAVTLSYVAEGKPQRRSGVADKQGRVRFTGVPLNVEVTVEIQAGLRKESKKVTLTSDKPDAYVTFGWMGHEVKIGPGVSTPPGGVPPPPPRR